MTTSNLPVARHPIQVDCPLCSGPATLDGSAVELDCPACDIRLELAADEPAGLPAAA
jgi:Zn finger protein HypA/HybF involved in hydrogenase expression